MGIYVTYFVFMENPPAYGDVGLGLDPYDYILEWRPTECVWIIPGTIEEKNE